MIRWVLMETMDKIKYRLIELFSQASTWSGVALLLTALGILVSPADTEKVIQAGLTLTGIIKIFFEE